MCWPCEKYDGVREVVREIDEGGQVWHWYLERERKDNKPAALILNDNLWLAVPDSPP